MKFRCIELPWIILKNDVLEYFSLSQMPSLVPITVTYCFSLSQMPYSGFFAPYYIPPTLVSILQQSNTSYPILRWSQDNIRLVSRYHCPGTSVRVAACLKKSASQELGLRRDKLDIVNSGAVLNSPFSQWQILRVKVLTFHLPSPPHSQARQHLWNNQ